MNSTVSRRPSPVPKFYDPNAFVVDDADRELFDAHLRSFVPPAVFDAHAHWYDLRIFDQDVTADDFGGSTWVGADRYASQQSRWMGDRAPQDGLFFPFPQRTLDTAPANRELLAEVRNTRQSRGLLMIRPTDDPADVERQIDAAVAGFKVYHLFATRKDSQNTTPDEFIPEWAWELADQRGLLIMLHMVLARSLAEPRNQVYIREHCLRYPNARLVLAHAARGFCGKHTVEGIGALRGLGNVFFDTSAVCEPAGMEAIIETFGATRLIYGSDFPISEVRGRSMDLGDSYHWLYQDDVRPTTNRATLIGIESLLALKQACRRMRLTDTDVERIFRTNALDLLNLRPTADLRTGQDLYEQAKTIIPGGTSLLSKRPEMYAPGEWPAYFGEARGCEVFDMDGRRYLDFATTGIGSCLLGYAHPDVTAAVVRRVQLGSMSTLNSPEEVELARMMVDMHPWAERARFARSGGEGLAVAIRIARASTRRDVIAFCGYHGWSDWYLAANLSGDGALDGHLLKGLSPNGVPRSLQGSILPFTYNKLDELQKIVAEHGNRLAAVIMEPTRGVLPDSGFLEGVRQLTDDCGARLIFDEVTTGFRLHRSGAHMGFGVNPDIAVYAKALGSGHPIAAIIGKAATMEAAQESFISSTYWTEGVGPTAAVATLKVLQQVDVPAHVRKVGTMARDGLAALATQHNVPIKISGHPALTYLGFADEKADALMTLFTVRMLKAGFLCGGAMYPTLAHQESHVAAFLAAVDPVFAEMSLSLKRQDTVERLGGRVKHSAFARLN